MLVNPATPWINVQNGAIRFKNPVTIDELNNGLLRVQIKIGSSELREGGSFEGKIYDVDQVPYYDYTLSDDGLILTLQRISQDGYIESVQLNERIDLSLRTSIDMPLSESRIFDVIFPKVRSVNDILDDKNRYSVLYLEDGTVKAFTLINDGMAWITDGETGDLGVALTMPSVATDRISCDVSIIQGSGTKLLGIYYCPHEYCDFNTVDFRTVNGHKYWVISNYGINPVQLLINGYCPKVTGIKDLIFTPSPLPTSVDESKVGSKPEITIDTNPLLDIPVINMPMIYNDDGVYLYYPGDSGLLLIPEIYSWETPSPLELPEL